MPGAASVKVSEPEAHSFTTILLFPTRQLVLVSRRSGQFLENDDLYVLSLDAGIILIRGLDLQAEPVISSGNGLLLSPLDGNQRAWAALLLFPSADSELCRRDDFRFIRRYFRIAADNGHPTALPEADTRTAKQNGERDDGHRQTHTLSHLFLLITLEG